METRERQLNFFRFEDLRIYHKALDYVSWVYETVEKFFEPKLDVVGNNSTGTTTKLDRGELAKNFIRAATNIALYIAEGSGRNRNQFIYYLKMARSSIRECIVLSTIAHKNNYISIEKEEESRSYLIEISKMLGALISSLQRSRRTIETNESENDDLMRSGNEKDPNMY